MEAAASIIAVLQLSEKVIKYIRDVSGATEDRKRLREQVRACSTILLTLRDGVEDSEEGQAWAETIELLASPLARLHTALELAAIQLHSKSSTKEKLKWPFKEKEVKNLMEAIDNEKGLLILALENNATRLLHEINARTRESEACLLELSKELKLQFAVSTADITHLRGTMDTVRDAQVASHNDLKSMEESQEQNRLAEKRQKILAWLSRVDQFTQQHDKASTWQAGTCAWFLELETYQAWSKELKDSTLLCPGMPGAGKTVLTSIVIADLWARYNHEVDVAVTFFFCEFTRQADQTVDGILLSILKQLVERRASPTRNMQDFYDNHENGSKRPVHQRILEQLHVEIASYSKVFILIDALDECESSAALLSDLLGLPTGSRVNFLATSRFIPEITNCFNHAETIEVRAIDDDVQKYLDAQILQRRKFAAFDQTLQSDIKQSIMQSVQGMFLLAKLHLDSLAGKTSIKAIRAALKAFVTGSEAYDSAYSAAMERIKSQVGDQVHLAKQVLAWIVHAKQQLTIYKLQEALGVEIGEDKMDRENCPDRDEMVSVCAGLVTVDEGSSIVRLVHFTTQEYFDRTRNAWFQDAEAVITRTCITYLSFGIPVQDSVSGLESSWPNPSSVFFDYAVHHWGHHARNAPSAVDYVVEFLLRPESSMENIPRRLHDLTSFNLLANKLSANLRIAVHFGLDRALSFLLQENFDHLYCPDLDALLVCTASYGHVPVIELLLQCGAAVNAINEEGTPLVAAVQDGHMATVQLLLEWQADVNLEHDGDSPLCWAVNFGFEEIVASLLKAGADVEQKSWDGYTPIQSASESGNKAIIRSLLDAGADGNITHEHDGGPLHIACRFGGTDAVTMLIDAGYDLELRDSTGCTPLHASCWAFSTSSAVELLLNAGADVHSRNEDGDTPLHFACRSGGCTQYAIKPLLDAGADVRCKNKDGSTPLHLLLSYLDSTKEAVPELVFLLIQAGADVNCKNGVGDTPLHCAYLWLYATLADNVIQPCQGITYIRQVKISSRTTSIKALLDLGADVNAKNGEGKPPCLVSCDPKHEGQVRTLLSTWGAVEYGELDPCAGETMQRGRRMSCPAKTCLTGTLESETVDHATPSQSIRSTSLPRSRIVLRKSSPPL